MKAQYIEKYKKSQEELNIHNKKYNELINAIEEKIEMREKQIERLEKKKERLQDEKRKTSPSDPWMAKLLLEELEEKLGLVGEIYGPFGLRCETSIYLAKEGEKAKHGNVAICEVPTWGITLEPSEDESGFRYETGKTITEYQRGSIGWLNGFGRETLPLPTDINEIIKLLKYSDKEKTNGKD